MEYLYKNATNYNAIARPFPSGSGAVHLPPMPSGPMPHFGGAAPTPPPAVPDHQTYCPPPPPPAPLARATPPAAVPTPPPPAPAPGHGYGHGHAPSHAPSHAPTHAGGHGPGYGGGHIPGNAPARAHAPMPKAPPPRPTGVGATKGKRGDAVYRTQDSAAGRIPMCAACGSQIRGPFVLAMSKSWCPEHFVCANPNCGVKLFDIGFVEEGGHLYCEKDYEQYFAPHCSKCSGVIIGECVNALNTTFHPQCFVCVQCRKPMGNSSFHIEDGEYYCDDDWKAQFQAICFGCKYAIDPGDRWVEALDHSFHSDCFTCTTCHVSLEGQPFYAKAGKPFCKKHAR